jgi:hypothetical protein
MLLNPSSTHEKYRKVRKQKAMKLPMMIPSLRFFAEILPIKLFNPGTCAAAPVILLLMLNRVSLCRPKLSFTAYA